jgi:hypothetical protein
MPSDCRFELFATPSGESRSPPFADSSKCLALFFRPHEESEICKIGRRTMKCILAGPDFFFVFGKTTRLQVLITYSKGPGRELQGARRSPFFLFFWISLIQVRG